MADKSGAKIGSDGKSKEVNAVADGYNWEQRVKGEVEAPKKWVETWGQYFSGGVPLDGEERIKFFEEQLKTIPQSAVHPVKYGIKSDMNRSMEPDFRRKKIFSDSS